VSAPRLQLVDDQYVASLPAEAPAPTLVDRIGGRCVTLLAGYVRGGCNNNDLLLRAVGLTEAFNIVAGMDLNGEQISDYIDTMLVRLQQLPDCALVRVQDCPTLTDQVSLITMFLGE
jgi:hypothetical protein